MAQSAIVTERIKTGLQVLLRKQNQNAWEHFGGNESEISPIADYYQADSTPQLQTHWRYRGQAAVVQSALDQATYLWRLGDDRNASNRGIYRQYIPKASMGDYRHWRWWGGVTRTIKDFRPKVYYRLGEAAGTTATDEMGAVNGTYTGTHTLNQTAVPGDDFNGKSVLLTATGTHGYITAPDNAVWDILDGNSKWSIGFWVNITSIPAGDDWRPIVRNSGTHWLILFWKATSGRIDISTRDGGTAQSFSVNTPGATGMYFCVWTRDGDQQAFYINGQLATPNGSSSNPATITANPAITAATRIGSDAGANGFTGRMDEVFFIDEALTIEQIKDIYYAGHLVNQTGGAAYESSRFCVAAYPDPSVAAGTRRLDASATAIFLEGVSKLTVSNVINIRPVYGKPGAIWFARVSLDADGKRIISWNYCDDIAAVTPTFTQDRFDHRWYREDMASAYSSDLDEEWRFRACPYGNDPRSTTASDRLIFEPNSWTNRMSQSTRELGTYYRMQHDQGRAGTRIVQDMYYYPAEGFRARALQLQPSSYWRLHEETGNFKDQGLRREDLTPAGTAVLRNAPGGLGVYDENGALQTSTAAAHSAAGSTASYNFDGTKSFTIAVLAKQDTAGQTGTPRFLRRESTGGWRCGVNAAEQAYLTRVDSGGASDSKNVTMPTDEWVFIVFRYNGSTIDVFFNGVKQGTGTASSRSIPVFSTTLQLGIASAADAFNGVQDETVVWERALSDTEIAYLQNGRTQNRREQLFYTERNIDETDHDLSNIEAQAFHTMCRDPRVGWSEPFPTGFSLWGLAGVAQDEGHLYLVGNGAVIRRPLGESTEVDLSNYAIEADLDVQSDNQKSSGTVTLANPANVVGDLLGWEPNSMTDGILSQAPGQRCRVLLGQKETYDDDYIWNEPNEWWVKSANRINTDEHQRIQLTLEDMWSRLETEYRTAYYYPGQVSEKDWIVDEANVISNYLVADSKKPLSRLAGPSDQFPYKMRIPSGGNATKAAPKTVDNRWRTWDGEFSAHFERSANPNWCLLIFRYLDPGNFHWLVYNNVGSLRAGSMINGVETLPSNPGATADLTSLDLTVKFRGSWVRGYLNGVELLNVFDESIYRGWVPGFVGFGAAQSATADVYDQLLTNAEEPQTTASLMRKALCHAGYFEHEIDPHLDEEEQIEVSMGPQTDMPDPAKAFDKMRESGFCQAIWMDGGVKVWQFEATDDEPQYIIQDEILQSDQADSAEIKPSIILVDGNEHSWTEYLPNDLNRRSWPVARYFDLPELLTQNDVRNRTMIEATYGLRGNSPGGQCVFRPHFHRLDHVQWIDPKLGSNYEGRIASMGIEVNQSIEPFQRVTIGLEPLFVCPDIPLTSVFAARDNFDRTTSPGLGTADIGGVWSHSDSASFSTNGSKGLLQANSTTHRLAWLASVTPAVRWQIQARFKPNHNFTGKYQTAYEFGIVMRYVNASTYDVAILRFSPNHNIRLIALARDDSGTVVIKDYLLPFKQRPRDQYYWIRAEILGQNSTRMRIKAWKDGKSVPEDWQLKTAVRTSAGTDRGPQVAGFPGLFTRYIQTSSPTVTGYVDDFQVIVSENPT